VSLPSGTSSPQHSTPSTPPPPARRARGRSAPPSPPGRGRLGAGRRHRDQKSVDIGHGILPPEVSAPSLSRSLPGAEAGALLARLSARVLEVGRNRRTGTGSTQPACTTGPPASTLTD
jgi:hypothetical protein